MTSGWTGEQIRLPATHSVLSEAGSMSDLELVLIQHIRADTVAYVRELLSFGVNIAGCVCAIIFHR